MYNKIVKIHRVKDAVINQEVNAYFDDGIAWSDYDGEAFETIVRDITDYITDEVIEAIKLLEDYNKTISFEVTRFEIEKLVAMRTMYSLMNEGYSFSCED